MARGRTYRSPPDAWPGFVDALSTLLMVIIFLLVVFVLAQFFLARMLEGKSAVVSRLEGSVADLGRELETERGAAAALRLDLARLKRGLQAAALDRDAALRAQTQAEGDRAAAEADLARFSDEQTLLRQTLESVRRQLDASKAEAGDLRREADALQAALDEAKRTFAADRETFEVKLGQLVQLERDVAALKRVREALEARIAEQAARLQADDAERATLRASLDAARERGDALSQRAASIETARQGAETRAEDRERVINALLAQLAGLNAKVDSRDAALAARDARIADLDGRLEAALADTVNELSQARSDFFGKLRRVLGEREDVRIVGDRFVFQSEVLFNTGEAAIEPGGRAQLATLARTFKEIVADIPAGLPWVLQVDGHTDRVPIRTARAISVAQFFVEQGLPPERVAARGFAEFQPLDPADTPAAYRRNRRIEIKLTTR